MNLSLIPTAIEKGHEAFYIGSKQGIEREMIESQLPDIKYYPISSGKLRRYLSFENAKDVFKVLKGILDARKILKQQSLIYYSLRVVSSAFQLSSLRAH